MQQSRTTTGLFLVVALAVIGYVLLTMPHAIVDGWAKANQISPVVGYIYVVVVAIGGLLLGGLALSILWHVWKNTRQKSADRERRGMSPSQMSTGAQTK